MKTREGRLGITYEKCVGNSEAPHARLRWIPGRSEPDFSSELTPEAERQFVETEFDREFDEARERKRDTWAMLAEAGRLLPDEAVNQCSRYKIDSRPIQVLRSSDSGRAFFAGLKKCGRLWICPVCAAKITEKRRQEVRKALDAAKDRGWKVFLLTLTIPHHCGNDARLLCDQLLKAYREKMQNRAFWREWTKDIGLQGSVRALEVLYGLNGAHVHIHTLLFCEGDAQKTPEPSDLLHEWQSACVAVGLSEPNEHGVNICDGIYAADYVAKWGRDQKWGLERELTKSHIKRSNGVGRTAWDLLRASLAGDEDAGRLFQEHAKAFYNRRQLVWSRGLRDTLGLLHEKSDLELAQEETEHGDPITSIPAADWNVVVKYEARASVLIVAETQGAQGVSALLRSLWIRATADRGERVARSVWRS